MTMGKDFNPVAGVTEVLADGLRRILAPNPSPMTWRGTNTYIIGEGRVAVIDPGPDRPAHYDAIIAATTISGTMVIGLAPVFLLHGFVRPTRPGFHLSFWTGIGLGIALTLGWIPQSWAIGDGRYALLLGTNLYGLILCTAGYLLPGMLTRKAV